MAAVDADTLMLFAPGVWASFAIRTSSCDAARSVGAVTCTRRSFKSMILKPSFSRLARASLSSVEIVTVLLSGVAFNACCTATSSATPLSMPAVWSRIDTCDGTSPALSASFAAASAPSPYPWAVVIADSRAFAICACAACSASGMVFPFAVAYW